MQAKDIEIASRAIKQVKEKLFTLLKSAAGVGHKVNVSKKKYDPIETSFRRWCIGFIIIQ